MLKRLYKDPLARRFVSGSFFAGAFVWVAVAFFGVDIEIVKVLFIYSIGFVGVLVVFAVILVPVVYLFRRPRSTLLASAEPDEDEVSPRPDAGPTS